MGQAQRPCWDEVKKEINLKKSISLHVLLKSPCPNFTFKWLLHKSSRKKLVSGREWLRDGLRSLLASIKKSRFKSRCLWTPEKYLIDYNLGPPGALPACEHFMLFEQGQLDELKNARKGRSPVNRPLPHLQPTSHISQNHSTSRDCKQVNLNH